MEISRRAFLSGLAAAAAAGVMKPRPAVAGISEDSYATLIDLTLCDGCAGKETPLCVSSCREANRHKFPEPDPAMLKPYWPQKEFDDWSSKRGVKNRLTPYNWIFVQKLTVEEGGKTFEVNVPRRCMHCDSPACVKLCPFGVNHKNKDGTVTIDPFLCFGGAKCKAVCPWSVPQRQAGVGVYTKLDPLPAGGGVMFKCDLCRDRLLKGQNPACTDTCPKKAILTGRRSEIYALAEERASKISGYIYGKTQNGGTSTLYLSPVPFEKLDAAILAKAEDPKKAMRLHNPGNMLEKTSSLAWLAVAAPLAGMATAFLAAAGSKKGDEK